MNRIKQIIKTVLKLKEYGLNKLRQDDIRTVSTSDFLEKSKEKKLILDIKHLKIEDQKQLPTCTGQAITKAIEYKFKNKKLSARWLYNLIDNMYHGGAGKGTSIFFGLKTSKYMGNVPDNISPDNNNLPIAQYQKVLFSTSNLKKAKKNIINGYAKVEPNTADIISALKKYGVLVVGLYGGKYNTKTGRIKKGRYNHAMAIYAIEGDKVKVINSWGDRWGDEGLGYFHLSDFQKRNIEIFALGDIPKKEIQKAKDRWKYKYFKPYEVKGLKKELIEKLDKAREKAGIPFIITSGYRSKKRNRIIGGVDNSSHERGLAVDLKVKSSKDKFKVVESLISVGINRIGIYDKHIHADIDTTKPNPAIWTGKSK